MTIIFRESFESEQWTHNVKVFPVGGDPYETEIGNVFTPAPGWLFWFKHDPDTWDQPEARHCWRVNDPNRIKAGNGAWMFFSFWRHHDAGLMRRVSVEPGTQLRLTAWAHAWSNASLPGHEDCCDDGRCSCGVGKQAIAIAAEDIPELTGDPWDDAVGNSMFTIGIDPYGGEDPFSPNVVWGGAFAIYNGYAKELVAEAEAASGTITVFLRNITLWPFKHNDAYFDSVVLESLGGAPPPPGGLPRIQYARRYVLLPQDYGPEWAVAAMEGGHKRRLTVGFSADDAGIGALVDKEAIVVNPQEWQPNSIEQFFTEYYPGTKIRIVEAATPEELRHKLEGEEPPPPPPVTGPLVSLHLQSLVEGALDFVSRVKPSVVKIFQLEVAKEIKARSPETLVVLRYFTGDQNLSGDLRAAAQAYVRSFEDSLAVNAEWIDLVESWNETIATHDLDGIRRAVEFDCQFAEALMNLGLPVAPQLLNVAVGNPSHTGGEIELMLPAAEQAVRYNGALGYHAYGYAPNGGNLNDAWQYYAGRALEGWDPVFRAHGLYPRYIFGECGAFSTCNDGWRSASCLNGDWPLYLAQLTGFSDRIKAWNAQHGNRCLGGTLFTSGTGCGWESFQIRAEEMRDLNWPV